MKTPTNKLIPNTNNQILTEIELKALREEFAVSKTSHDIHDLILTDIAPEMLQALLKSDSITIIAKQGQQELHFQLCLTKDGVQGSLQGSTIAINHFIHQNRLHKFQ